MTEKQANKLSYQLYKHAETSTKKDKSKVVGMLKQFLILALKGEVNELQKILQ